MYSINTFIVNKPLLLYINEYLLLCIVSPLYSSHPFSGAHEYSAGGHMNSWWKSFKCTFLFSILSIFSPFWAIFVRYMIGNDNDNEKRSTEQVSMEQPYP